MSALIDAAFAAVPRSEWSGGALWREPNHGEAAHYLRHVTRPERRNPTPPSVARILELRARGMRDDDIATLMRITPHAIRTALYRERRRQGVAPAARATPEQIAALLAAIAANGGPPRRGGDLTWAQIGAAHGLSADSARMLWRRYSAEEIAR